DGTLVVYASLEGMVWDTRTGKVRRALRAPGWEEAVTELLMSPTGTTFLGLTDMGSPCLWDQRDGRLIARLEGRGGSRPGRAYSPSGRLVVTGGDDGTTRLWQGERGFLLAAFRGSPSPVRSVAFSTTGDRIVVLSNDSTVRLYPTTLPALVHLAQQAIRHQPEYESVRLYFESDRRWRLRPQEQLVGPTTNV